MSTFAVKARRRIRKKRASPSTRFAYRSPEAKNQQQEIHGILFANGAAVKLSVGKSNDKTEQEADRVADQVMSMPDGGVQSQAPASVHSGGTRVGKPSTAYRSAFNDSAEGLPLSARAFFEPRFGWNFSQVRIHNSEKAAQTARSVNARAFTLGRDIVFDKGEYSPGSSSGRRLLAHELTHVVQQNQGGHTHSSDSSRHNPPVQAKTNKALIQRSGPKKIKPFKGAGWVKEESARIEKQQRKNLENYAKKTSPASRRVIRKKLSWMHLKFVNWCESSTGKDAKALLQYLKNTKHSVSCWPNEDFPFEVTINGPRLKLASNTRWPWWPSKVKKAAVSYEPRILNPHMYAYHVSMSKLWGLQPEMKELIDRYSGYATSDVPVKDKRLLTTQVDLTRPNQVKWKSLSNEMRVCWRAAVSQGKSRTGQKGIDAFKNLASALHNSILLQLKHVYAKFNHPRTSHQFKKLVRKLKYMASDNNSAMYSYRKDIKVGLLTRSLNILKKWWRKNRLEQ